MLRRVRRDSVCGASSMAGRVRAGGGHARVMSLVNSPLLGSLVSGLNGSISLCASVCVIEIPIVDICVQ
ncbi:hypothetical protein N7527_005363, partial [Penicillium freii]